MSARFGTTDLTARDGLIYLADYAPNELRRTLITFARDSANIDKRDALLQQIDSMSQWLTVMRRAVCNGRLGL